MGKSKNGGTRSYIRGRIGSDVYSIGKDGKGKKQQVIRSLAETVANPQTQAQMRGRMIMSTVMQAVAGMAAIVDHSFDGVVAGQPSISEFIRVNYAAVKADVAANPASGNAFGLNKYQEKGVKAGAWIIADGKAVSVSGVALNAAAKTATIAISGDKTFADLLSALGLNADDYFTICAVDASAGFVYARIGFNAATAAATVLSADNIASVLTLSGNVSIVPSISGSDLVLTLGALSANNGIIVSRKVAGGYIHNDVVLATPSNPDYAADVALPTYPVGSQRFLNGGGETAGVVSGGSDSSNTPDNPSQETVAAPVISGTTPFDDTTQVTITGPDGASIYYTTDGSTPTSASTAYANAITLSASTTVKAIAIKNGVSSDVATKGFTKNGDNPPEND